MSQRAQYKAETKERASGPDPRLVALVKYLARRAAEINYRDLQMQSAAQSEAPRKDDQGQVETDS